MKAAFNRYIGIDYSGAETCDSSLKGLRVYTADRATEPQEVAPPPSLRKYWTRKAIAERLAERLSEGLATLVGIDHGFSFPLKYFEKYGLPYNWIVFLNDFQEHWPTDEDCTYVDFVRDGACGNGAARGGDSRWRRITEVRAGAKSVFHFDVPGSVAKSTHAGIPWLRFVRMRVGDRIHFWPFDGWKVPPGKSAVESRIDGNPVGGVAELIHLKEPLYAFDPDSISHCFPRYGRVMSITGHTRPDERVIAPIPEKSENLKQAFIQKSYSIALPIVRQAGVLVAVGYSFNPYDRASYHRILEALGQSKERTLFVVSPQAREPAKRISNEYPALRVEPVEKAFSHWAADSFRC